jgi:hypothetical protein
MILHYSSDEYVGPIVSALFNAQRRMGTEMRDLLIRVIYVNIPIRSPLDYGRFVADMERFAGIDEEEEMDFPVGPPLAPANAPRPMAPGAARAFAVDLEMQGDMGLGRVPYFVRDWNFVIPLR